MLVYNVFDSFNDKKNSIAVGTYSTKVKQQL